MNRENAVDTFTGLFDSLHRHKSDKSQTILSGCEAELQELMRQIDIMVNAKKLEWDNQLHVLQLHLDKKKKETGILKIEIGAKVQENENLKHQITAMDQSQRELISEYENKLSQLRDEVDKLRKDHEKLQRKSQKCNVEVKEENDRLKAELYKRDLNIQQMMEQNEDFKIKIREWDSVGRTYQGRVKGLETENLTLKDKNEIQERQSQEIQVMLNQRKHTLENLEKSHQMEIVELEVQITKLREEKEQLKKSLIELQEALEDHETNHKDKGAEIAYMEGRLRHAHEIIQELKHEKEQLQLEMDSKCDLVKHLEEKQRYQIEDLSHLERSLHQKEGMIRDLQDTDAIEESSLVNRLREDVRICHTELSSKKETEQFLRAENERLSKSLQNCEAEFKRSNVELIQKNEQLASQGRDEVKRLIAENDKLKGDLQNLEGCRGPELEGMKREVDNLTSSLHQRDQSIATMSEKMKKLERDLRNSNSEYDKGNADLHVVKAQLDALRLENRHLKEATLEGELRDLDLYHSNQQFMASFQKEDLEKGLTSTEESSKSERYATRSPEHSRNSNSTLKSVTNEDRRKHINVPRGNLRFSDDTNPKGSAAQSATHTNKSMHSGHHQRSSSLNTSGSDFGDMRALSYGDLKAPGSDYERAGSPSAGSRRSSVTTNFLAEETRREKELQRIFDGRLNELKLTTKNILDGHPSR